MLNGKVLLGILGVGTIGKIHTENLMNHIPWAGVIALSDLSLDKLATMEAQYDIPNSFFDYGCVLKLPEVDAVAICTPPDTHYRMILDAAEAGKHIFCEMPLDLPLEKIREIRDVVEKTGVKLMAGFNRRFDSNFLKAREKVQSGQVGVPHLLRITSRDSAPPGEGHPRPSGRLFLDMTIHDFDMARYLAGSEVTEVYAKASAVDPASEETGDWHASIIMLSFENGALGAIDSSRKSVYGCDHRIEVFGSQGMIAVNSIKPDGHLYLDRTGAHMSLPFNLMLQRYLDSYQHEMSAFVDAIRENNPMPVTVEDGLMAVAIGLAANRSAKENRPVRLTEVCDRSLCLCEAH